MIKYNRLMEKVTPSPEVSRRLHDALDRPPARKPIAWRRNLSAAVAACLVLVLGGTAILHLRTPSEQDNVPSVSGPGMQEYASIEALAAALPFPLALPETLPEDYTFDSAADQFGMAVVVYADADGNTLKYCMGEGDAAVSGIYHSVSGTPLGVKDALLYQDDEFTSVEWQDKDYSYCLIAEQDFSTDTWRSLVESVH